MANMKQDEEKAVTEMKRELAEIYHREITTLKHKYAAITEVIILFFNN